MTNKDAIILLKDIQNRMPETNFLDRCAVDMAIEALEERQKGEWIEVKTRPCTDEEFEEFKRLFGDDIERKDFPYFDCSMPVDGEEILICTSWDVDKDKCEYDPDYGYTLEGRGDWEDVIAWMPSPKPYRKEKEE